MVVSYTFQLSSSNFSYTLHLLSCHVMCCNDCSLSSNVNLIVSRKYWYGVGKNPRWFCGGWGGEGEVRGKGGNFDKRCFIYCALSCNSSITFILDVGKWSTLCPTHFICRDRFPTTHGIGGWVCRPDLDLFGEEKNVLLLPGIELWFLCHQSVFSL